VFGHRKHPTSPRASIAPSLPCKLLLNHVACAPSAAARLTDKAKDTIIASGEYDEVVDKSMEALCQMILNTIEEGIKDQLCT